MKFPLRIGQILVARHILALRERFWIPSLFKYQSKKKPDILVSSFLAFNFFLDHAIVTSVTLVKCNFASSVTLMKCNARLFEIGSSIPMVIESHTTQSRSSRSEWTFLPVLPLSITSDLSLTQLFATPPLHIQSAMSSSSVRGKLNVRIEQRLCHKHPRLPSYIDALGDANTARSSPILTVLQRNVTTLTRSHHARVRAKMIVHSFLQLCRALDVASSFGHTRINIQK